MSVAAVYAEDGKSHAPLFLYRQAARYPGGLGYASPCGRFKKDNLCFETVLFDCLYGKKQAFRCETRRERSFHTDKNRLSGLRPVSAFFCMAGLHGSKGRKGRLQHFDRKSVGRLSGYCSDRSAHLLRRPYKNVQEGSIRPIAKRLEWPDAITVLPKAEQ